MAASEVRRLGISCASLERPGRDFDTAAVPSQAARQAGRNERTFRDPHTEMPVIDWYLFYNDLVPETMEVFLRVRRRRAIPQGGRRILLLHVRVRRGPGIRP